jgi:hypothetical protein
MCNRWLWPDEDRLLRNTRKRKCAQQLVLHIVIDTQLKLLISEAREIISSLPTNSCWVRHLAYVWQTADMATALILRVVSVSPKCSAVQWGDEQQWEVRPAPWRAHFSRTPYSLSWQKNSPSMEPRSSLLCKQQPATEPCPEPDESIPHLHALVKIRFNSILPDTPMSPQWSLPFRFRDWSL